MNYTILGYRIALKDSEWVTNQLSLSNSSLNQYLMQLLDGACTLISHYIFISDLCEPNPCLNGGVCSQISNVQFICNCVNGFTGTTCQTSKYTPVMYSLTVFIVSMASLVQHGKPVIFTSSAVMMLILIHIWLYDSFSFVSPCCCPKICRLKNEYPVMFIEQCKVMV